MGIRSRRAVVIAGLLGLSVLATACASFGPQNTAFGHEASGLQIPAGWRWWPEFGPYASRTGYILTDGTLVNPTPNSWCGVELEARAVRQGAIIGRGSQLIGRMDPGEQRAFFIAIYTGAANPQTVRFAIAARECF